MFQRLEGNTTNPCMSNFSCLLAQRREPQSSNAKLLLPIIPIGIVAYAFTPLWDNLCRDSCIIDMFEYYNFPCFDLTNLTNAKIKHYVSLMQQKYNLYRQHTIQNSFTLEFFNSFKNDHTPSSYLGLTSKLNDR